MCVATLAGDRATPGQGDTRVLDGGVLGRGDRAGLVIRHTCAGEAAVLFPQGVVAAARTAGQDRAGGVNQQAAPGDLVIHNARENRARVTARAPSARNRPA